MTEFGGPGYYVYVPPRWNDILGVNGRYVLLQCVWNIQACVTWEEGGMQKHGYGTFGECWESKEWKGSLPAEFRLDDGMGGWGFFTRVAIDEKPMREEEYLMWIILGHTLRTWCHVASVTWEVGKEIFNKNGTLWECFKSDGWNNSAKRQGDFWLSDGRGGWILFGKFGYKVS